MTNTFPEPAICRAGCAQQKITPPLGLSGGLLPRPQMISCDLISISEELSLPAKAIIDKEVGIPPENVLICATHTHTGPEVGPSGVVARSEEWFSNAPRLVAERLLLINELFPAE